MNQVAGMYNSSTVLSTDAENACKHVVCQVSEMKKTMNNHWFCTPSSDDDVLKSMNGDKLHHLIPTVPKPESTSSFPKASKIYLSQSIRSLTSPTPWSRVSQNSSTFMLDPLVHSKLNPEDINNAVLRNIFCCPISRTWGWEKADPYWEWGEM